MNLKVIVCGYLKENCYILEKDDKCLIIDPGDDFDIIDKMIVNPVGVLITHHHFDHIGALKQIQEKYNVNVYDFNNLKEGINNVDSFIFEVIITKGHTSDSLTYYFEEDNIMFTGDFIFKDSIGRTDLGGNDIDVSKSIEKIKKYNNNIIIYPGHGDKTTLGYEKNNIYLGGKV